MLFDPKSTDVVSYAGVIVVVWPIIVLAVALPAWRCLHADSMIALRKE